MVTDENSTSNGDSKIETLLVDSQTQKRHKDNTTNTLDTKSPISLTFKTEVTGEKRSDQVQAQDPISKLENSIAYESMNRAAKTAAKRKLLKGLITKTSKRK
ncbi:hypothetical protein QAD02_007373 [Eretmocerus hayati]|uniref:Uncharacterized protein n=1 Tax=Eretmocerus hayati TaxID=131215 RepID=A0ACC2N4T7_9HYME|nr:hypothetical protein QAD02_007373 [Eretmocerus hayati]